MQIHQKLHKKTLLLKWIMLIVKLHHPNNLIRLLILIWRNHWKLVSQSAPPPLSVLQYIQHKVHSHLWKLRSLYSNYRALLFPSCFNNDLVFGVIKKVSHFWTFFPAIWAKEKTATNFCQLIRRPVTKFQIAISAGELQRKTSSGVISKFWHHKNKLKWNFFWFHFTSHGNCNLSRTYIHQFCLL